MCSDHVRCKLTLLLGEVHGILLGPEGQSGSLHVVRSATTMFNQSFYQSLTPITHELAHPIKGFCHRPAPCRMSQSMRQLSVLADPLCIVFRVGLYIRTAR
jgi:hypothetical protein